MGVRVVTDSTAGLPARLASGLGIVVVPLSVLLGDRSGLEGVDVGPADVADALRAGIAVTTSQPSAAALSAGWDGAEEIVSVHLSSALSGTFGAAVAAARVMTNAKVEVVDSGTTAMGLGFVALAAGRVAERGGTLAEVVAAAREAVQQTDSLFCLDTVDALHRGGRSAVALVETALSVKPIMHVVGGAITPLERVRTWSRGLQRLLELTIDRAEGGRAEVAVMHLAAPARAEQLARQLDLALGASLEELELVEVGAVVGAHVGLGCVGVAVHRL